MKKIISVFLALTMLCAIFTVPVAATMHQYSTEDHPSSNEEYYILGIEAFGQIYFFPEDRQVHCEIWCHNITSEHQTYTLYGQCVVLYADGSYDIHSSSKTCNIQKNSGNMHRDIQTLSSGKTVVGFDAEFQIYDDNVFWEGYLYPTLMPGINI